MHGGDIYSNKIDYDFSISTNPMGCPKEIQAALQKACGQVGNYPDPTQRDAKNALASVYKEDPARIICGNGASELFCAAVSFLSPKRVLLPVPSFTGYAHALSTMNNCDIREYKLSRSENYRITEEFLSALTEDIDLCFLCNPNNPSGQSIERGLLERIFQRCEETGIYLIYDGCFSELSEESAFSTSCNQKYPHLIFVNAFTKTFATPGARAGFLTANEEIINGIKGKLPEWNLSVFGNAVILAGCELLHTDFLSSSLEKVRTERKYLQSVFSEKGIHTLPSDTCFFLVESKHDLYNLLLKEGILIRNCADFSGIAPGTFRISVRSHEENIILAERLNRVL